MQQSKYNIQDTVSIESKQDFYCSVSLRRNFSLLKFGNSEKATKFENIFPLKFE